MPTTPASLAARNLAATAETAPVRMAVIQRQSMTARGWPVWTSFKITSPITGGMSKEVLPEKLLTHLSPAAFFRGRYPGMA